MADRPGEAREIPRTKYLRDQYGLRLAHCHDLSEHGWHGWVAANEDLRCPGTPADFVAALDLLTARLSEAERERDEAQQWCVDEAEKHDATKTRLARAERHLSDYEQALRDLLADLPVVRNAADWNRISSVRAARAALSGSTRPDDASV